MNPLAQRVWRHVLVAAPAAALAAGALVLAPEAAHAAPPTATISVDSEWRTGYTAGVTIRNLLPTPLTGWRVEFDLPTGTSVTQVRNARILRSGQHVTLTPVPANASVPAGGSTRAGFTTRGTGKPTGCLLNGAGCDGRPDPARPDVAPPSTPTNLRTSSVSPSQVRLSWDPSTDDRAVTSYQIFINGNQIGTTTETSLVHPVPPPSLFAYAVRAADAAGNLSPFGVLAQWYPTDTTPPSAPGPIGIGFPGNDLLRFTWTPATDNVYVSGYEVALNGVVVSRTGGTFAYGPYTGFGIYQVRVRAFDAAGNYGPPVIQTLAVDPPPPLP